jgi:uncharacterized protein DUF6082
MRYPRMSRRLTEVRLGAMVTAVVTLLLAAIVLSPLTLSWIAGARTDRVTPANIGEAYGGVAAVLAGLALCGVVVSTAVQRRQLAIQTNLAIRERQFDLTRMLLEYPDATARLYGSSISADSTLLNLHIAQFWLVFETETHDPEVLKEELALVFQTEFARRWWTGAARNLWRMSRTTPSRAFAEVVDEAVELARSRDVASHQPKGRSGANAGLRVSVVAGMVGGASVVWWAIRRR